ncbi:MAG: RsmB/NOP family class I SAM-dependent RNA methyltransferase [Rhizobiaceae bacterium]
MQSRLVATTLLTRIIDDGRNLDALCDRSHGIKPYAALDDRDQGLARAITVTALRNRNRIDFILKKLMKRPPAKNARFLTHTLHIASAQILFMEVPERAAVNIAVGVIGNDKRTRRFRELTNAVLRRMTREKEGLLEASKDVSPFPEWLAKQLRSDYGRDNTARIAPIVMHGASVDVSVKNDPAEWAEKLGGFPLPTGSVRLRSATRISELPGYGEGEWWVQDAAAAIPARLINADKGAEVLELCAAPGGKTAQLANLGYKVTALDISETRLSRLQANLERLKFNVTPIHADLLDWEPECLFDAVLLDAPCSSTGTVRRHPDILWSKSKDDISTLAELQFALLNRAITFVKRGGCIVFSNCSLLKQEGEDLLGRLLKSSSDITLSKIGSNEVPGISEMVNGQGALRSLPFHLPNNEHPKLGGVDGFFACRFIKN